MLPECYRWILSQFEAEGNPWQLLDIAKELVDLGELEDAASVLDRAYGIEPKASPIQALRQEILDLLAIDDEGLHFRYIPAGPFLMGNETGDPDERPWHPVWLSPYWLSDTPISWYDYCRLMNWNLPDGEWAGGIPLEAMIPPSNRNERPFFTLNEENKIRLFYSGMEPRRRPIPGSLLSPESYSVKPMVSVSWQAAEELANSLSREVVRYGLPTEAQWEKAARGGRIGSRHAWGDETPTAACCDFNRFGAFSILPMRTFAANGYGLYAMNGCVWEWTRDWYDADYYRESPLSDPTGPAQGEEKVLRGGSWADCAAVQTVSFRMSWSAKHWRERNWGDHFTPNIGFRLCRWRTDQQGHFGLH